MNEIEEALDYMFRLFDDKLTPEEIEKEEALRIKNQDKKISNNPYCAFGCYEGEEIMSLDTH